jgi:hypothetical protein
MGAALSILPVRGRPIGETRPPQKTVGCIDQHRKVCIVQRNPTSANCIERGELGACCVRQRHAQAGNQHQSPEQPSCAILPPSSVETELCGHYAGARCHHFENSPIWTADTALLSSDNDAHIGPDQTKRVAQLVEHDAAAEIVVAQGELLAGKFVRLLGAQIHDGTRGMRNRRELLARDPADHVDA